MKTVVIEKPVRHLMGLIERLESHEPKIRILNVGVDARRTYVYLPDDETQDPTPIVADWEDPAELRLVPMGEEGPDGVPEAKAGGDEAHLVIVEKADLRTGKVVAGDEELFVCYHGSATGSFKMKLENGVGSIQIGPVLSPGEITVDVNDHGVELGHAQIKLRFVGDPPPAPAELPQPSSLAESPDDSGVSVSSETIVSDGGAPIGSGEAGGADLEPPQRKPWWKRIWK